MKISRAFESKLQVTIDSKISKELAELENMSACAGIKGDAWNAYKAKINHYGGTLPYRRASIKVVGEKANGKPRVRSVVTKTEIRIPARPFMDVPMDRDKYLLKEFEDAVAQVLSGGHGRSYVHTGQNYVHDSPSKMTNVGGPKKILKKIANILAESQRDAILIATPPNAPSTIKRKGVDAPLRDTYEMYDSIKGWVE